MIKLSFSSWSTWKQCPKKFELQYLENCASQGSPALQFGSEFHRFLEASLLGKPPLMTVLQPLPLVTPGLPFERYSEGHFNKLWEEYERYWGKESFKVLEVEKEIEFNLTSDIIYTTVLDGLIEHEGEICVFEHKTTSGLYGFSDKAFLSLQAVLYSLAAQKLGYDVTSVLFNGIDTSFGKNNKKLLSRPNELFQRVKVNIEDWQKREAREIFIKDARRIIEDIQDEEFSKNAPGSCFNFFRPCEFASVCSSNPEDRGNIISTFEKRKPRKFEFKE